MKTADLQQIEALEKAILDRAKSLADELLTKAGHQRDDIQREAADRVRLTEKREISFAKAEADRLTRRQVQAGELKLQARLDQLRWELVLAVQARLAERMRQLRKNRGEYTAWLEELIREGARLIPDGDLVAEVDRQDMKWLPETWDKLVQKAAPKRNIELSPNPIDGSGGIRLLSNDGHRQVDNRFEGRMARMEEEIQRVILRHLVEQ